MSTLNPKMLMSNLVDTLIGHNYNYYVLDKPTISDADWDVMFHQLKALEADHPHFIRKDSPTQTVGHPIVGSHFAPMRHRFPMLSLDNSLTVEALIDWTIDISENLGIDHECRIEWKMDGLSLDLLYYKGRLVAAVTRGDGEIGENVTLNALQIPSIPKTFAGTYDQDWFSIRGEVVANLAHYHKLNEELTASGKQAYANPRNYAAGALRQKDPAVTGTRGLEFYCYSVTSEPQVFDTWGKERQFMLQNDFLSAWTETNFEFSTASGQHFNIPETVNKLQSLRRQLPFEVDGLVIKVMTHATREKLGYTSKFPRWATAYKFPATEGHTELLDIEYQIGRTGQATPVARLKPVTVHGTTISNVTLHNRTQIERLKLYKGCQVIVKRAGDVIPKIEGTVTPRTIQELYAPLTNCPCCGTATSVVVGKEGEQDYCNNPKCPDRLLAHLNYCTERKVLNIKGLGPETVKALFDKGLVHAYHGLAMLDLTAANFVTAGLSEHQAEKMAEACAIARANLTLERALMSFGIDGVAEGTSERLARHYQSMDRIAQATVEELEEIKDIGTITAESIYQFFDTDNSIIAIEPRNSCWYSYINDRALPAPAPRLINLDWTGFSVVVTGSNFGGQKRKDIEALYKQMGASIASNVSSKTKLVLCGTKYTARKLEDAKAQGVDYKVYDETGVIDTNIVDEISFNTVVM
jgi:DNA ligase (NAD+)